MYSAGVCMTAAGAGVFKFLTQTSRRPYTYPVSTARLRFCVFIVKGVVPRLPGLPHPGDDLPDASRFVSLDAFLIKSADETLTISANATLINPIETSMNATIPSLPFVVYLPPNGTAPPVPLAHVQSPPFALTYGNTTLGLTGVVLPLPRNASQALSEFLGAYVSVRDADILLETTLLPGVRIPTKFPAPHPAPQILRDVKIKDMKVKPVGQGMVASGTVLARIVLPPGSKSASTS